MSTHSEAVLSGLEKQLAEDESGDVARELMGRFVSVADRLQARLRAPLSQEGYRAAEGMRVALTTAAEVVERVWQQMHSNQKLHL
jgi:hypothetical protein